MGGGRRVGACLCIITWFNCHDGKQINEFRSENSNFANGCHTQLTIAPLPAAPPPRANAFSLRPSIVAHASKFDTLSLWLCVFREGQLKFYDAEMLTNFVGAQHMVPY